MMLSFSTCWNMHRHRRGEPLVEELLRLGFDTIELGHGLRVSQLEGILKVYERGDFQISSLHNFCPQPLEVPHDSPDCYEFTSHRAADRRRAIKLTRDTIELAQRVGAALIVVHGGRVRTMKNYQQCLAMIQANQFLSKAWGEMKVAAVKAREQAGPLRLSRLEEALRELLPVAEKAGVTLALENRERYEDVPSEREMIPFLNKMAHPNLAAWHDFGHAQIKENLGFLDHHQWLERIANRLVGCHVHDVIWPNQDHQPPCVGSIPFEEMVSLLPDDIPVVFELSPHLEVAEVVASWNEWRSRFS